MKRRPAGPSAATLDGKWRRPLKRANAAKMNDSAYANTFLYVKLISLWLLVLFCDHFLEFRFEYLWPTWLFVRSVYDSFKYQGLAFSVFFICIALTSDMLCFVFIPVNWLFFAASTYVWVQYVWQTEKGFCAPTVSLWLLLIFIEGMVRWRDLKGPLDLKHGLPFHLDLCRPFAAHCIGYPVVTMGFGVKSYVGFRMRERRQREIQRENEYYFEFMREALPPGPVRDDAFNPHPSPKSCPDDNVLLNGAAVANGVAPGSLAPSTAPALTSGSSAPPLWGAPNGSVVTDHAHQNGGTHSAERSPKSKSSHVSSAGIVNGDADYLERKDEEASEAAASSGGGSSKQSKSSGGGGLLSAKTLSKRVGVKELSKLTKEELLAKMEVDVKKLKTELQQSRNKENDLREQIISYMSAERHLKSEISNLQVEKSLMESRISGLQTSRAGEKAALSSLEKRLAEERKQKTDFQLKLETERKSKKDAANAERTAQAQQTRSEVSKLEAEIGTLRSELQASRERCQVAEQDAFMLRKLKEKHGNPEELAAMLKGTEETVRNLRDSLKNETKVKMELFSELGGAKREIGVKIAQLKRQDEEIAELKKKVTEMMALAPPMGFMQQQQQQPSPTASLFAPTTTLSLDLPAATDLSFTGKIGGGLFDGDGAAGSDAASGSSLFPSGSGAFGNGYAKANGKINHD